MKPPAFQFYPDDFIGGTCDLSAEEVGAYIRLLCYQWSRGIIPDDPAKLARIAGVNVTLDTLQKFPEGKNPRLEFEREKQAEYRAMQSAKGQASAKARLNRGSTVVQPSGEPQGQPEVNSPSPSPSPSPSLIPDSKPKQSPAAPEGFEEFWQAYPNKTGKANAIKVWNRDKPNLKTVLDALVWQKKQESWTKDGGQFIPHASTYLNGRRYEDEKPKPPAHVYGSCLGPVGFPKGHSFL